MLPQARKLGILPDSVTPSQETGGGGEWVGKKKSDLRSKLDSRPRQILVVGARDKDALTTYFEVKQLLIAHFHIVCLFFSHLEGSIKLKWILITRRTSYSHSEHEE